MTSKTYVIDQKEEKERKNWLKATLFCFIFYPIILIVLFSFLSLIIPIPEDKFADFIGQSIVGLISLWILWHCAYTHHGTAWLTCSLFTAPCWFLKSIIEQSMEYNPLVIAITIFEISIFIWWYNASIKLRIINKKIQAQKQGCQEYLQSIENLKNSLTIEALDNLFYRVIQDWPQFEPVSSKEYKSKKSELLKERGNK